MDFSQNITNYIENLKNILDKTDVSVVNDVINLLRETRDSGKQIFIMGNGGSGANASHIAGDFNKGLSLGKPRDKRYKVISLVDNSPTVLSLANDVSYDDIFVEQLKNFLNDGDVLFCISGSGNSENVIRAATFAKENGNKIVGFTGYSGGKLKEMADITIHAPIDDMQIAEDVHMIMGHLMFSVLYHTNA